MNSDIGKAFLEKSKYQAMGESDQQKGVPQPALETVPVSLQNIIQLPDAGLVEQNLKAIIDKRISLRKYAKNPVSLEELSYLLWTTQGVKTINGTSSTHRTVPSAGARHALDTYILVNNVEGLNQGLYRYIALEHKIAEFKMDGNLAENLTKASLNQKMINTSAVTFIWAAVMERMTWRYQERGFRYIFLDAGHVCQNLYLASEAIGCGTCAIAAYDDDKVNELLGFDGVDEFVIYMGTVGKYK